MTCREKLKIEHPENVGKHFIGGCWGCPHQYGYLPRREVCTFSCRECWDQEIPNSKETEIQAKLSETRRKQIESKAKDYHMKFQALRHQGFTEDQAMQLLLMWMDD
jgi:hypothetical protein